MSEGAFPHADAAPAAHAAPEAAGGNAYDVSALARAVVLHAVAGLGGAAQPGAPQGFPAGPLPPAYVTVEAATAAAGGDGRMARLEAQVGLTSEVARALNERCSRLQEEMC
jgi:hypothetical protein